MGINYIHLLCIIGIILLTFFTFWLNGRINELESKHHNVLSDKTLKKLIAKGKLVVTNIQESDIQPASIDICISNDFLKLSELRTNIEGEDVNIQQNIYVGKGKPVHYQSQTIPDNEWFCIKPGEFVLASAKSYLKLPSNIVGRVEGKYSIGRQGLLIQNTGIVDPGYEGKITLELFNITKSNIYVKPGQNIAQIMFFYMDKHASNPYNTLNSEEDEYSKEEN